MKDLQKGLSFNSTGKLNMKLGINDFSASDVINKCDEKTLNKIFKYFGDEKEAKFITKKIIKNRILKEITTEKLVNIIENTKRKKNFKIHSSTKIFQALRIFVNKEISELIYGLINSAKILKKDGILAIITLHSLEDRIVKYYLKNLSESKTISRYDPQIEKKKFFEMPKKNQFVPTEEELKDNPPSRSAKLRY